MSARTIKVGLSSISKAAAFYYSDFKLTKHDSMRIEALVQSLVLDGKLTTDVKREKQWMGSVVVAKMVEAAYQDALDNGVLCWDRSLAKTQSLVLVAALGCRVGDVSWTRHDRHDLPYLTYGDLDMKLVGGSEVQHLVMLMRMRNDKGKK